MHREPEEGVVGTARAAQGGGPLIEIRRERVTGLACVPGWLVSQSISPICRLTPLVSFSYASITKCRCEPLPAGGGRKLSSPGLQTCPWNVTSWVLTKPSLPGSWGIAVIRTWWGCVVVGVWWKTVATPTTPFPGRTLKKYDSVPANEVPVAVLTFVESTVTA